MNRSHFPAKSPTAQDEFRPISGLISCARASCTKSIDERRRVIIRASNYRRHHYCNCPSELLTFYYQEQKEKKCNSHSRKHPSAAITDVVAMFAANRKYRYVVVTMQEQNGTRKGAASCLHDPKGIYEPAPQRIRGSSLGTLIMQLCPKNN